MTELALAQFQNRHLQVEDTSQTTIVPNNNTAKLMFYLHCITDITDMSIPSRLTNYENYNALSSTERLQVFALAVELSPDKVPTFVEVESLPENRGNKFFKFWSLDETVTALGIQSNGAAMMALRRQVGNKKQVLNIMAYTPGWIRNNYLNPLMAIRDDIKQQQERQRRNKSRTCALL